MQTFSEEVSAEVAAAHKAAPQSGSDTGGDENANGSDASSGEQQSTGDSNGATPGTGQQSNAEGQQTVPRRALEDEREKRQYERQLRESLERRIAELETSVRGAKAETQAPAVDYEKIFEDPKGVLEAHTQAVLSQSSGDKMGMSREMARAQLPDYDDTIAKLATLNVPGIEDAVAKSPAPAFTAYRMVKDFEKQQQQASQGSEKVRELEAKLAEATAQLEAFRNGGVPNMPSLSQSRGATAGTQQPVKTVDSVLDRAWGKTLRKR